MRRLLWGGLMFFALLLCPAAYGQAGVVTGPDQLFDPGPSLLGRIFRYDALGARGLTVWCTGQAITVCINHNRCKRNACDETISARFSDNRIDDLVKRHRRAPGGREIA